MNKKLFDMLNTRYVSVDFICNKYGDLALGKIIQYEFNRLIYELKITKIDWIRNSILTIDTVHNNVWELDGAEIVMICNQGLGDLIDDSLSSVYNYKGDQ